MKRIAILGAGLTGLSAAYHLHGRYDIFEQEAEVGGLCRTMRRNGFLFDYTGHLLHVSRSYTKQLIQRLLPEQYHMLGRQAYIYTHGRYVNYPFQANLYGLPPEVVKECIMGFVETLRDGGLVLSGVERPAEAAAAPPRSFHAWVLETFGAGIAKHFMFPYNQKIWRTPLTELSADWVAWAIPKPTLDEFLNGALGIRNPAFGYNPTFLYPKTGGAERLPQAFLRHLRPDRVHYGKQVVAIDAAARRIRFADQSTYHYDALIATLPLKHLVALLQDAPEPVTRAGQQLRHIAVYNLNLGVNRPNISEKHWIYFPEPEFSFYRVGFPTNFSDAVAPAGCSSMYVEVSALPHETLGERSLLAGVYDGLQRCGILTAADQILVSDVVRIDCAYVLYDLHRTQALNTIQPYLRQQRIYAVGRYGAWEYSAMEDAILAGKQIAETLRP